MKMIRSWLLLFAAFLFQEFALAGAVAEKKENPYRNFTVINPKVDALLQKGPDWVFDVLGGLLIALGALFAFFGLKTMRLQSTFYGACICGGLASFVLYWIPGNESAELWLAVVIPFAVLGGYVLGRVVMLRKFILFVAFGVAIAGVFNQYALSYISRVPDFLIYMVMIFSLVFSAILIWRHFHFSAILATSFLGGFLVLLGTARLMRGEISLSGMWVEPDYMHKCITLRCWLPFLVGAGTFGLGVLFQLIMRYREKHRKKANEEAIGEEEVEAISPSKTRDPEMYSERHSSPYKSPPKERVLPGNPFATGANDDPLIVELTETLENRRRRQYNDVALV